MFILNYYEDQYAGNYKEIKSKYGWNHLKISRHRFVWVFLDNIHLLLSNGKIICTYIKRT